jgi:hypothetical protein
MQTLSHIILIARHSLSRFVDKFNSAVLDRLPLEVVRNRNVSCSLLKPLVNALRKTSWDKTLGQEEEYCRQPING